MKFRPFRTGGPLLFLLVLVASPVEAQQRTFFDGMRTGVGYAGVAPEALAGIGVFRFVSGPLGVFADGKMTLPTYTSDATYCPPALTQCSVTWVETHRPADPVLRDEDQWLIFNVGGIYALTGEFAVMVGGGMARRTHVREYLQADDDEERISPRGTYFVDGNAPEWVPQGVAGFLIRAGESVAFRVGYESAPGGMSIGAYFVMR